MFSLSFHLSLGVLPVLIFSLDTRVRVDVLSTPPLSDSFSLYLLTSYFPPSYLGRHPHLAAATLATLARPGREKGACHWQLQWVTIGWRKNSVALHGNEMGHIAVNTLGWENNLDT